MGATAQARWLCHRLNTDSQTKREEINSNWRQNVLQNSWQSNNWQPKLASCCHISNKQRKMFWFFFFFFRKTAVKKPGYCAQTRKSQCLDLNLTLLLPLASVSMTFCKENCVWRGCRSSNSRTNLYEHSSRRRDQLELVNSNFYRTLVFSCDPEACITQKGSAEVELVCF